VVASWVGSRRDEDGGATKVNVDADSQVAPVV
jgi:hypothetical protein